MRLPFVSRRYARGAIAVATAGLRADLEATQAQLAKAEAAARRLPQTETEMECADLRQRVKELLATVDELRAGVVDDSQTAELRRRLTLSGRTIRDLGARLNEVTAANHSYDKAVGK